MKLIQKSAWMIGALFIFALFFYITSKSPLAGDDWGYAVNGLLYNPFELAFKFYTSWSGRFFSELYGFLIAPNRNIWNVLNPSLFVISFYFIYKLAYKKHNVLSVVLIIFLMVTVKNELRMETYSWLMGTTYVIPLALSLYYLYEMKAYLLLQTKFTLLRKVCLYPALFVIGMSMENMSAVIFLSTIAMIIYQYLKTKELDTWLISLSATSLVSLLLLRLSPGASFRLERDHPAWLKLNLFEQITQNYPNFIRFTFIEHRYLMMTLSLILIALILKQFIKHQKISLWGGFSLIIIGFGVVSSAALTLSNRFPLEAWNILLDSTTIFNMIFWPIYIGSVYYVLWTHLTNSTRLMTILIVSLAGLTNGVMLLSPIFSYRSSIYTVYLLIALIAILSAEFENRILRAFLILGLGVLILRSSYGYYLKYQEVAQTDVIRSAEIQYYVDHPEIKEAWFIRYPVYSIHSGDIEEWDSYHMDVFRRYYGIANDVRLIFYHHD